MEELVAILWPFALFVALVVFLRWAFWRPEPKSTSPPYKKQSALISDGERQFYHVLRAAVGAQWTVLLMVRLTDVVSIPDDVADRDDWQKRIEGQRIEFLICDAHTLEPKAAIDLDDRPPEGADEPRNPLLAETFAAAGLPLLRVPMSNCYNTAELRGRFEQALK
jgi:hypothetical protein